MSDLKYLLDEVRKNTRNISERLTESHGWDHTLKVVRLAKLMAPKEDGDIFCVELAAWMHDWGRLAFPKNDKGHASLSAEMVKQFLKNWIAQRVITPRQYGDVQRAIRQHSQINSSSRKSLSLLRDADRLSRYTPDGLYQVAVYSAEKGFPFFLPDTKVLRNGNEPLLRFSDVRCTIDEFNLVYDYWKIIETPSAKLLQNELKVFIDAFLNNFANEKNLQNNSEFWLTVLKKNAEQFKTIENIFFEEKEKSINEIDFYEYIQFLNDVKNDFQMVSR
jgi:uncharacterized protein